MTRSPSRSPLPGRQATTLAPTELIKSREIRRRAAGSVAARQTSLAAASARATMPTELNVLDPVKPARAAINSRGRLVDCPARGLGKDESALAPPFRRASQGKTGRDHLVERSAGIDD